jgi:hypothetical protein
MSLKDYNFLKNSYVIPCVGFPYCRYYLEWPLSNFENAHFCPILNPQKNPISKLSLSSPPLPNPTLAPNKSYSKPKILL